MALDINGYNATFDAFVKFAESAAAEGKQKAVARFDADAAKELGRIVNRTIKPGSGDWVGIGAGRLAGLKRANNITRDAFRKAVADMFGGESHIPESVLKAMKLEDYGKGKPLTARRILAVKEAIDAETKFNKFSMADSEYIAKTNGWTAAELPKLARAAHFLSAVTGKNEVVSIERLSTPGTKENRLMNYGGRFLQSAENFKNGLRLLDAFSEWYDETNKALWTGGSMKYEEGMSKTVLNARGKGFKDIYKSGTEKFVFEELAFNPTLDLAATDVNDVFGMEKNHATSCIGRDFSESFAQTFAQVPPEKRPLLFKSLTVFYPLYASNAEQAKVPYENRNVISSGKVGYLTGRILKHLDQIAGLSKDGKLDAAHLVKLCFPEIKSVGANPIDDAIDIFNRWDLEMYGDYSDEENPIDPKYSPNAIVNMQTLMEATGCTIEEADTAYNGGHRPPNVPYYSDGSLDLSAFDGTTKTARETLVGDLTRPTDYSYTAEPKKGLLGEKAGFTFNLPDGERLVTNSSEQGKANVNKVVEKLEALCGKSHPRQASSLLMMLSQSGLVALKGGLRGNGIESDEHVSMDFTITRDTETGDVTIRYSSPEELPFSFEWTATIKPDGYVSTTPMKFVSAEARRIAELVSPKALADGYHKSELPMLANAFALIKAATGCSEAEALEKTLDPQSRERRLFGYGGRFTASTENFRKGLALMDKFGGWYKNVVDTIHTNKNRLGDFPNPTVRNADWGYLTSETLKAYEKFLFEEIAANDSLPLDADNPDAVFGMEANAAMRFVGRGYTASLNDTVARMPVEVRQVLFAAFDVMQPLARDATELRDTSLSSVPCGTSIPVSRVMRHLDGLREMQKAGNLTAKNVKKLLFPDVRGAGTKSLRMIVGEIQQKATAKYRKDDFAIMRIFSMMVSSGCPYDEAVAADNEGRILPSAPYILSGTGGLDDLDGTARGARKQAVGDLIRPSNPKSLQTNAMILPRECQVFTVNFPDGTVLKAGASDNHAENEGPANAIADKVTELVGDKHQAQLATVMIGLSQSAHGPFQENSVKLGFVNEVGAEHSALTYTFSRNDDTGAVTIRYSEPQGFPKKFHWEMTIALDGSAVTTPLVVEE